VANEKRGNGDKSLQFGQKTMVNEANMLRTTEVVEDANNREISIFETVADLQKFS
jgi:hypothetical protein